MIYTDRMGHLISDTNIDELHQFAEQIGLRREWFQDKPGRPHYDLTRTTSILDLGGTIWVRVHIRTFIQPQIV